MTAILSIPKKAEKSLSSFRKSEFKKSKSIFTV
jgi:hypothetical protein